MIFMCTPKLCYTACLNLVKDLSFMLRLFRAWRQVSQMRNVLPRHFFLFYKIGFFLPKLQWLKYIAYYSIVVCCCIYQKLE